MNLDFLQAHVLQFVTPTAQEWSDFIAKIQFQSYQKNHYLHTTEKISNYVYFISKGIVRHVAHLPDEEGTIWFSFSGDLLAEIISFFSRQPAYTSIQALTEVEVFAMTYDDLQALYDGSKTWERYGRLTTQYYLLQQMQRTVDFQFKPAKQRYEELLTKYPDLTQEISLGQIASFLGITQEALSRIRAKS